MSARVIEVGTSGWSFEDWAGVFYPFRVPRSQWLEYYAARFGIGELNSTYYRIASPSTYAGIARKTPDEFRVLVKLHADATHQRKDVAASVGHLLRAIDPLKSTGKLTALLAQYPASFTNSADNRHVIETTRQACSDVPLCVEFRDRSWTAKDVPAWLCAHGITWVTPDEPELEGLLEFRPLCTTDTLYVRLHGRNRTAWYDRSAGDRYDYLYTEEELQKIGQAILEAGESAQRIYVLFNNCHAGKAVQNAQWLKQWLTRQLRASLTGSHDEIHHTTD
jgi:uncharacterized protein YecE (DUF72 family)